MKKLTYLIILLVLQCFMSCVEECKDGTLSVTNPFDQDAYFSCAYEPSRTIGPGETYTFTDNFMTEFSWTATWYVDQPNGDRDVYIGFGTLEINCGEHEYLTLDYQTINPAGK